MFPTNIKVSLAINIQTAAGGYLPRFTTEMHSPTIRAYVAIKALDETEGFDYINIASKIKPGSIVDQSNAITDQYITFGKIHFTRVLQDSG